LPPPSKDDDEEDRSRRRAASGLRAAASLGLALIAARPGSFPVFGHRAGQSPHA
jgi:hypothetical protein